MKRVRRTVDLLLLATIFLAPALLGSDLSSYRGFRLGMSLTAAVKHSGMDPSEVTVLHKRPALMQELQWRPSRFFGASSDNDPVDQVDLGFIDGQLFRIVVDYDRDKLTGMTAADLIDRISAQYGPLDKTGVAKVLPSLFPEEPAQALARWEDAHNSLNLVQLSSSSAFKLVIFDEALNARAETAVAEGVRLDTEQAPGLLKAEQQSASSDLNRNRIANKAHFRP